MLLGCWPHPPVAEAPADPTLFWQNWPADCSATCITSRFPKQIHVPVGQYPRPLDIFSNTAQPMTLSPGSRGHREQCWGRSCWDAAKKKKNQKKTVTLSRQRGFRFWQLDWRRREHYICNLARSICVLQFSLLSNKHKNSEYDWMKMHRDIYPIFSCKSTTRVHIGHKVKVIKPRMTM